jgi:hypothetical protein
MNFIEAVKKFYSAGKSERETFIVRESGYRSEEDTIGGLFFALGLDAESNLCSMQYQRVARCCRNTGEVIANTDNNYNLTEEDFLAEDWRVFNADTWETEEE